MNKQRNGGFIIGKIHHLGGRILAKKLRETKLAAINPAQGRILFVLWQKDNISIQDLAKETSLGKSTLTSMLDRLETNGYLVRVPSAEDRRIIFIRLTEKNRELRTIYEEVSRQMTELFYAGFTTGEIDNFEGYLKRIFDNLTAFERQVRRPKHD